MWLNEALEYKDLEGVIKPTIHIDEFASKMGDDADIIVLSFFVRNKQAADDLMNWFEKGYDWILDADVSPGEISPGRYLVYIEARRRSYIASKIDQLLDDLNTLCEFNLDDWVMTYEDQEYNWNPETFSSTVPSSPKEYRKIKEKDLNEMRVAAGVDPKKIYEVDRKLRQLQSAAGI